MPRIALLPIFIILLPVAVFADCRDFDCLRACRSCDKPSINNGWLHCPTVGFDCNLTSPNTFAMTSDAGVSGKDCVALKCTDSYSLFVRGEPQDYLACFQGQWRLPGNNEAFTDSTDGAVCLQKCDENSCTRTIPAEFAKELYTNANIAPPNSAKACAFASCLDEGSLLYGGFRNTSEPLPIESGGLTCTGSGLWRDETGRLFDFPACKAACAATCDKVGVLDYNPPGYTKYEKPTVLCGSMKTPICEAPWIIVYFNPDTGVPEIADADATVGCQEGKPSEWFISYGFGEHFFTKIACAQK